MSGKLNFAIALNLLTDNFKKGVNTFENSLRSMQAKALTFAAALGFGGLGLSNLVSRMIEVARQTNRVTTALRNVSESAAQFASNQNYLLGLADKYGVEITSLTSAFTKFTASASASNVPMEQQKKIFESVSRATVAFGLSQEEGGRVFYALSQMMSKGKISAEELRRQMGEQMPIALAAMAKAAGVTIGELDDLLKQGKLLSAEILPAFADALNEMIPNVNTDNLETSLNRLQNIFTETIKNSGVIDMYKGLVDKISEIVSEVAANITGVIDKAIAVISAVISGKLLKGLLNQSRLVRNALYNDITKNSRNITEAVTKDGETAKQALRRVREEYVTTQRAAITFGKFAGMAFQRVGAAIKGFFLAAWPMLLMSGIAAVIEKVVGLGREAKRVKNIFSDYLNDLETNINNSDVKRLESEYSIAKNITGEINRRQSAIEYINKQLGTSYTIDSKTLTIQGDINEKLQERIKLIKAAAAVEFLSKEREKTELDIKTVSDRIDSRKSDLLSGQGSAFSGVWNGILSILSKEFKIGPGSDIESDNNELVALTKKRSDIDIKLLDAEKIAPKDTGRTPIKPDGDPGKDLADDAIKKYTKTLSGYDRQLQEGVVTEEEYRKAKHNLTKDTLLDLVAMGNLTPAQRAFTEGLKKTEAELRQIDPERLEKASKEFEVEMVGLANQYRVGIITEEEYREEQRRLIDSTRKKVASFEKVTKAENLYVEGLNDAYLKLKEPGPKMDKRDSTFDYKKSKEDILGEELSVAQRNLEKRAAYEGRKVDDLTERYKAGAKDLSDELNKALENVTSLEDALKIAEVKADVKALGKELNKSVYGGVKDMVSGADRMRGSFERMAEVLSDVDASGWEKILSVWDGLTSTVDQILGILDLMEEWTELSKNLATAKQQEAAIDTQTTSTEVSNAMLGAGADVSAAAISSTAAGTKVVANTAVAASSAGASAAGLPFPLNIIAIAGAITAVLGIFAALPKFAGGGVVKGGSGVGDKVLAGVNPGEMILNSGQQGTLFNMIKSGSGGGGQIKIDLKLKGKDLVGSYDNFHRSLIR